MIYILYIFLIFVGIHVLFALFCLIVSLTVDMSHPIERQSKLCRVLIQIISMIGCGYIGIKYHATGIDKLPTDTRFVMVSNHRAGFDPFTNIWNLRKYNISYISKPSNFKIPIGGKLAYGAGFLPINRDNDREAIKTIITAADYIKKDFCSIAIYPEGTRSKTLEVLPFHAGSFKLAQKAHVPLVIVSTYGGENAIKNLFRRRTDVYMDVLEVLDADSVSSMKTVDLSDYARRKIIESLNNR